jgi:AbrB family looped-hinge helix DNA binding protein
MKSTAETVKVGKRGTLVIPSRLRKRTGLSEGDLVIIEEKAEGLLIRPAVAMPVEIYTPERKAEFFLNNAVNRKDYQWARREVKKMGLDPDNIPHDPPRR